MQRFRMSGLAFVGFLVIGALATAHPYSRGNAMQYDDMELYEDSVAVFPVDSVEVEEVYLDSLSVDDCLLFDEESEYEALKNNRYLKDPETALEFRRAASARMNGNFDEAWFRYKALADSGYPYAQYWGRGFDDYFRRQEAYNKYVANGSADMTGEEIYNAVGVLKNYLEPEEIRALYEEAFSRGYAPAAVELSLSYYLAEPDGFLNPVNREKSLEWTRKGIERNDSVAIFNMGVFYDEGMMLPNDDKKAVEYYEKAAAMNMPGALNNLSNCYLHGKGVKQDVEKGLELKRRAARAGHGNNATLLALNALLTGEYDSSLEYARLAVNGGRAEVYNILMGYAMSDRVPSGLKQNPALAQYVKDLYSEALVSDLLHGVVMENIPVALDLMDADWDEIARKAESGDTEAMKQMVWDSLYGLNSPKDYNEALRRLEKLTALDESYRLALSYAYQNEYGKTRDFRKAKENLEKFIADHDALALLTVEAMKTGDEDTLNKFLSFGAPGIAFNQYDELYTTLDDSYDKESNGFRLPSYIAEGPAKLESYISLLGRKDEIVRKAAEGDADALYDLYQLIENDLYMPEYAPGISSSHLNYLYQAARKGNKDACKELAREFSNANNEPGSQYWMQRANGQK